MVPQGCAGVVAGYVAQTQILHNDIANTSNVRATAAPSLLRCLETLRSIVRAVQGAVCVGWGWGANNVSTHLRSTRKHA